MDAKTSYHTNFGFGAPKRILSRLGKAFILAVTLVLASSYPLAADPVRSNPESAQTSNGAVSGSVPVQARYRVFAFRHISTEQARSFLAKARLGTASQLPAANMLLVTALPRQLIKITAILRLIDATTPFVMKAILPAEASKNLPSNEQIAAEVGSISIGSFSNPPTRTEKVKAIIDIHDDAVVAIAPADKLEQIIEAIEKNASNGSIKHLQKAKADVLQPIQAKKPLEPGQKKEPKDNRAAKAELERIETELEKVRTELNHRNGSSKNQQVGVNANKSEPNELFDKLLDSLSEAEKKLAELAQPAVGRPKPNESAIQPGTLVTPPEKSAPIGSSVGLERPVETALEAAEPTVKKDVTVVPKKTKSEKITAKPKPELKPEQVRVEPEEPNAVTKVVEPDTTMQAYQPEFITSGDDTLELDMPPKINIIDLLDLVGKYLNLDYMYDPVDVTGLKGEVSLRLKGPIKVKDLYPLAESVLKFKGFVMTRKVDLITIVPVAKALLIDPPIVDPKKRDIQPGNVIITRIFELKHINTASAKNLLDAMKLGADINTSISELDKLIVTGYAYRMSRIEQLLALVDKPGEEKKFRSRPLKYTMAKTLASKVKALAEQLGTVSIAIGATAAAAPTSTTRRPGESTAAYQRRLTTARAARIPPSRTTGAPTPSAEPTVYLDADERTNRILMIGLEEQLTVVDKLIDALDVEQQDLRTLKLYEIQHVDAEDVMTKLSELGIISGGRATTGRTTTRTTTTRPPPTRPTTPPTSTAAIEEPLVEEPQVVIIEPTNSLLVNATAEQHTRIAVIIGYVDAVQEEAQNPYVIYQLENQDPTELAGTLEKLISETVTEKSAADAKVLRTTTTKRTEEEIIIVDDPKSYSLIVYASKKNQQWIASLIKELDAYRPQVLLDVTLVEVTKNEKLDLDLDATLLAGLPKLSLSAATGAIEKTSATAFYKDKDVHIILQALQEKGYGRILARPKLLVNDNEEGTIKTEEQTSIAQIQTKVIPAPAGGVPTASQDVSFKSYTAGITLTITPHISKGRQLGLAIMLTRTDFRLKDATKIGKEGDEDIYPTPPDLLISDVTSNVTVPDGTTIILGGLERIRQGKGGTKVPLLGDIPLLGGLFRTTSNQNDQSRLYVFLKANIIRPGEEATALSDIEVVSAKNRATFEKYEKEMQEYEDWPGIKPKPMDPVQILETDEDEVISLKSRQVSERYKKGIREGRDLPGTRPKLMHPMQILAPD